jgi:hypothetical protein
MFADVEKALTPSRAGTGPNTAAEDTDGSSTVAAEPVGFEQHTHNSGFVRDAIIGLADGLTVPFALTAGLSS